MKVGFLQRWSGMKQTGVFSVHHALSLGSIKTQWESLPQGRRIRGWRLVKGRKIEKRKEKKQGWV